MEKKGYVYILASARNGTLYIGVTSDLNKRTFQHQNKMFESFSKKYNVTQLVYYETYNRMDEAITREKAIKNGTAHGNSKRSKNLIRIGTICLWK